jgi:hypothetical protein
MDGAGDQLLAGARFAADQHRGVAARHLLDHVEHALERAARADDPVEIVDVVLGVTEVVDLVAEAPVLERLLDLDLHLLDFERLRHVVERADAHRFDGGVHRSERGHQDDHGVGVERLRRAQHVETVGAAHLEVAQHDVERPLVQLLDGGVAVRRLFDVVPGLGEAAGKAAAQRIVIVGDENSTHSSRCLQLRVTSDE